MLCTGGASMRRTQEGDAGQDARAYVMSLQANRLSTPKLVIVNYQRLCVIAEQAGRRRRRAASGTAGLNGLQRRAAGATDVGATRKRAQLQGNGVVAGLEGQLGLMDVNGR